MSKIKPTPRDKQTEPFWKELNKIIDPELGLGLIDIGLIYNAKINKKGIAEVVMTFTTAACPVGPDLVRQVQDTMLHMEGVTDCNTQVVFDPPWTQDMIDPDIQEMLFGI